MNGGNQTHLTATNIENGQFAHLVSAGKSRTQFITKDETFPFSSISTSDEAPLGHSDASPQTHSTVSA